MRKILTLCMVFTFILTGMASAEVKKHKDEVGLIVSSYREISYTSNFIETVIFSKHIINNEIYYRLSISTRSIFSDYLMKNSAPSIAIDKYPNFYLDSYHYKSNNRDYALIEAVIPLDLVDKLKEANVVNIRIEGDAGNFIPLNQFYSEWKQVINAEE